MRARKLFNCSMEQYAIKIFWNVKRNNCLKSNAQILLLVVKKIVKNQFYDYRICKNRLNIYN